MQLTSLDWWIILLFFGLTLAVGLWLARSAGRSTTDFFLSGRNMPWWLLPTRIINYALYFTHSVTVVECLVSRSRARRWGIYRPANAVC